MMGRIVRMYKWILAVAVLTFLMGGCSKKSDNKWEGVMSDTSYAGAREKVRPNALGEDVQYSDYDGYFVWADYSAPWCHPCVSQATVIKKLSSEFEKEDVYFVTVITSSKPNPDAGGTVADAKAWASRFGLAPEDVLAADLWFKTVPEHYLYSPSGQVLFHTVGMIPASRIRETLKSRMADWKAWDESGTTAKWMR